MPDRIRVAEQDIKYQRDSESYEHFERKRKKHKRHKDRHESDVEIVKARSRRREVSEVIEVHGSSSEDGEINCDERSPESTTHRSRRKHSHNHSKKHKKEHTRTEQASKNGRDLSHDSRKHSKINTYSESKRVKHKRRVDTGSEEEEEEQDRSQENVLAENVCIKDERINDLENSSGQSRRRVKEEQGRRLSPADARREIKKETSVRNDSVGSRAGNSRDVRQRVDGERSGRSGGPSRRRNEDDSNYEWGRSSSSQAALQTEPTEKEKPDFKLSGKLTEDRNTFNGVVIKYSEPPESRMPKKRWRLYQFKGDETLPTLYIHRQSAYLIGRDRKVADLPVDHPSCSKQHAALQYRLITFERPNGSIGKQIRLYVIDLESANGTFINGKKIESKKYVELMEKDVIKFGFSSREYVLLHEQSRDDDNSEDD